MGKKNHHPYHDNGMFKGAPSSAFEKARRLRKNMTRAETILWEQLKNKRFYGYKFRRQHPIHLNIVDFYCHELGLIIEVDGGYHNSKEQKKRDKERTENLTFQDLRVIRFTNDEVINNVQKVLTELRKFIGPYPSTP